MTQQNQYTPLPGASTPQTFGVGSQSAQSAIVLPQNPAPSRATTEITTKKENPIRFPHIPARTGLPAGTVAKFHNDGASHRVDSIHTRTSSQSTTSPGHPSGAASAPVNPIPGIRTRDSIHSEASDDHLVPFAPTTPPSEKPVRPALPPDVAALTEQMRRRLLDFGNLLASRSSDARLESAFETVCQSFSQLDRAVERNTQQV